MNTSLLHDDDQYLFNQGTHLRLYDQPGREDLCSYRLTLPPLAILFWKRRADDNASAKPAARNESIHHTNSHKK